MLKELIKLSYYLNNSKYSSELNKLIKLASDLETHLSILNDYLIEIGKEEKIIKYPKSTRFYQACRNFLYSLKQIYDTHPHDNLLQNLCKNVLDSIDNTDILSGAFNFNYINKIQENVLKDVLQILIDYFINNNLFHPSLTQEQRNDLIRSFESISSANIDEIIVIRDDIINTRYYGDYLDNNNDNFWLMFNKLIKTCYYLDHYEFVGALQRAAKEFNFDLLSILKNRINIENI